MIGFDVQFEFAKQTKFTKEIERCFRVAVVLMCRWLVRFRFDEQGTFEADLLRMIGSKMEKTREVFALTSEIGIE